MTWLFALTSLPVAVVIGGLLTEFIASRIIGDQHAPYAAFALVLGYFLAKAQPSAGEAGVALSTSVGGLIGLAVLWWHLFKREKANG